MPVEYTDHREDFITFSRADFAWILSRPPPSVPPW
jgi:hypothetical protein